MMKLFFLFFWVINRHKNFVKENKQSYKNNLTSSFFTWNLQNRRTVQYRNVELCPGATRRT